MDGFTPTFIGGSIANLLFVILFAIGAFIKSRLQKSDCKMNCGWISCDSSLVELTNIKTKLHHTQRDQMEFLKEMLVHVQKESEIGD